MVEKPLINCYVFVLITKQHYLPVLETENVAGFVKSSKDLRAIPEAEMEILRRITLENGLDVSVMYISEQTYPPNLIETYPPVSVQTYPLRASM